MKMLIDKMFQKEIEYIVHDENLTKKLEELEGNIAKFKEKLFRKKSTIEQRKSVGEHVQFER